ncbi:hypothetical protein [Flavihumibacter fluvii]|uniref:hypothetical protein n=1 Tax=Flavihumibacter fluvii TaxID=2838157 RepID=UPI001EFBE7FA|nr:hypothetical protein [Flavihumibacter fluvii]ULQ53747.1 hypothetical protein KJS93_05345 [Flavihumibacter fluvii]
MPLSFFSLTNININGFAFQFGGFTLAHIGNGASSRNHSPFGFFGGAGILGNYAEPPNDDDSQIYRPPIKTLGLAFQAGPRFSIDKKSGDAIAVHFTYRTDFKVKEKRLFDVKIVVSGLLY